MLKYQLKLLSSESDKTTQRIAPSLGKYKKHPIRLSSLISSHWTFGVSLKGNGLCKMC